MKAKQREIFLAWYEEHKHEDFDMQRDIVDYCISDVEILTASCLKFRELLIANSGCGHVDPFMEATTIASACNKIFRRNFLKQDSIGLVPHKGYRLVNNQSVIALKWLVWRAKQLNINIKHAGNGGEVKLLGSLSVDGYCEENNKVFEFYGCYWHAHPACYKFNRDKHELLDDDPNDTLHNRYEATLRKAQRIRDAGYDLEEIWECDFRQQLSTDKEMSLYVNNHPIIINSPLNPRDAFYGGRTENFTTYYKVKENEKIKYLDVCSLYPYVCKYGKFPVGHPKKIHIGPALEDIEITIMNGIIKCTVLPPRNLFFPVLPLRVGGKLLFTLCRKCAETSAAAAAAAGSKVCLHDDEADRCISGTWVIDEVRLALAKGYKILKIHEIWEFDIEQYDPVTKTGGLFSDFINTFLRYKQQASGFPQNVTTTEDKTKYIENYLLKEGIQLELADIVKNPGLRSLSKLILNSFWVC